MEYGGAIYVDDDGVQQRMCFVQVRYRKLTFEHNIEFDNNTAEKAGSALYGGMIDSNCQSIDYIAKFKSDDSISSTPYRVCFCTNGTINKKKTTIHIEVFPGQIFDIEIATVGQRYGLAPTSVRAKTEFGVIEELQKVQDTQNVCTKVKSTIKSAHPNETMNLSVERNNIQKVLKNTTLHKGAIMHDLRVFVNVL